MPCRVVIIGGGFAGLEAASRLNDPRLEVTLIDRRNFHLFQPLLYQVATGGLSPANIAAPLRGVLRKRKNVRTLLGEVIDLDALNQEVVLKNQRVPYDSLIVATGSEHHYFGHPEWESLAPGLKSLEDATRIRSRILSAFEEAEASDGTTEDGRDLTFVVVGGGPTGVELAGAVAELAHRTLSNNFRRIQPGQARILLVEGDERILPMYPPKLSTKSQQALERLGVTVRCNSRVTDVTPDSVTIQSGDQKSEFVPTETVLWAAGVRASQLGKAIAQSLDAATDKGGRILVNRDCTIPDHPNIFVIGDLANHKTADGNVLPGLAPVAIQQGRYAARVITARLDGGSCREFVYKDRGQMSTIGRGFAVAQIGKLHFSGVLAWLAWLFIHLIQLVGFENRLLVFVQWAGNYLTRNRAARLITQDQSEDEPQTPQNDSARTNGRSNDKTKTMNPTAS